MRFHRKFADEWSTSVDNTQSNCTHLQRFDLKNWSFLTKMYFLLFATCIHRKYAFVCRLCCNSLAKASNALALWSEIKCYDWFNMHVQEIQRNCVQRLRFFSTLSVSWSPCLRLLLSLSLTQSYSISLFLPRSMPCLLFSHLTYCVFSFAFSEPTWNWKWSSVELVGHWFDCVCILLASDFFQHSLFFALCLRLLEISMLL